VENGFIEISKPNEMEERLKEIRNGFIEISKPNEMEEERLKEIRKKHIKELFIIQQRVHETLFSCIAATNMSKEVRSILKKSIFRWFKGYKSEIVSVTFEPW